ncbi:hypothetical protein PM8797T_02464 [Gimesia maris DSM 8797]|nr:hypothetical protein PM8797T_02464 [Gimesia maris DSM 8797]
MITQVIRSVLTPIIYKLWILRQLIKDMGLPMLMTQQILI